MKSTCSLKSSVASQRFKSTYMQYRIAESYIECLGLLLCQTASALAAWPSSSCHDRSRIWLSENDSPCLVTVMQLWKFDCKRFEKRLKCWRFSRLGHHCLLVEMNGANSAVSVTGSASCLQLCTISVCIVNLFVLWARPTWPSVQNHCVLFFSCFMFVSKDMPWYKKMEFLWIKMYIDLLALYWLSSSTSASHLKARTLDWH